MGSCSHEFCSFVLLFCCLFFFPYTWCGCITNFGWKLMAKKRRLSEWWLCQPFKTVVYVPVPFPQDNYNQKYLNHGDLGETLSSQSSNSSFSLCYYFVPWHSQHFPGPQRDCRALIIWIYLPRVHSYRSEDQRSSSHFLLHKSCLFPFPKLLQPISYARAFSICAPPVLDLCSSSPLFLTLCSGISPDCWLLHAPPHPTHSYPC